MASRTRHHVSARNKAPERLALKGNEPTRPAWIRVRARTAKAREKVLSATGGLTTVCEEAACPNIGECWERGSATFMILGAHCTRTCGFCHVMHGRPNLPDPEEPEKVARAVARLGLRHVVVTSVDRDDLWDGGAIHFARTIRAIRRLSPGTRIEVLIPDFKNKPEALEIVAKARPDYLNHNVETVPRLYKTVRPGSNYEHSLKVLRYFAELPPELRPRTKSGLMVGLGETNQEVVEVMKDLRSAGVEMITIGQYLRPSPGQLPVARYVRPEEFDWFADCAVRLGFKAVASAPLVRSSYWADYQADLAESDGPVVFSPRHQKLPQAARSA